MSDRIDLEHAQRKSMTPIADALVQPPMYEGMGRLPPIVLAPFKNDGERDAYLTMRNAARVVALLESEHAAALLALHQAQAAWLQAVAPPETP